MSGAAADAVGLLVHAEELLQQRDLPEAILCFTRAEHAGADANQCAAGRWTAAMLLGNFAAAWQESDAIRSRGGDDPHRFWMGEAIDGRRLMVRCLHGLGDSVQMLRYLPLLQQRCASVTVEVPPRLLPLAASFAGMQHAITWGNDAPAEPPLWDLQVEAMELPYLLRTDVQQLPLAERYLSPPSALTGEYERRMGKATRPRVGVVWSASEWDRTRRLPIVCVEHLLAVPGVEFWNLQGGEEHTLGKRSHAIAALPDAAEFGDGLPSLAAVLANLDLVLTVDTLAGHMAGAMGKPAWVLLQAQADWRWLHGRDKSPWYPSLTLWRQPVQDDWWSLTTRVAAALAAWADVRSTNGE